MLSPLLVLAKLHTTSTKTVAEVASHDFETRSARDLRKAGVDAYSEDPTTGVWCLAYGLDDAPVVCWEPGDPDPTPLLDHISNGKTLAAWNSYFEAAIWQRVIPRICPHWPTPRPEQFDCTMARSYAHGLPGSLEWCAKALSLELEKDREGHALMMRMASPTLKWKKERLGPPIWYDDRDRIDRLKVYCIKDVEVERELRKRIAPLTKRERQIWLLDQKINRRGVLLDIANIDRAEIVVKAETLRLNKELSDLTGGKVKAATAPGQLGVWLGDRGIVADDMKKHTVKAMLDGGLDDADATRALQIRQEAGKASTAKLRAMKASANDDGRARGLLGYHVATTGRWAGRRVQPQNLPRPEIEQHEIEHVIELLGVPHGPDAIRFSYMSPILAISSCLRAMIIASPGHKLIGGDFSNIEGRVLAWLAGEQWKQQAFRDFDAKRGADLYKLAYARSFGLRVEDVDKDQRQIGKVQELALGYQGGPGAFMSMAAGYNADIPAICRATMTAADDFDDFWAEMMNHARTPQLFGQFRETLSFDNWCALKYLVNRWRAAHPQIYDYWYDLQNCAIEAVLHPGRQAVTVTGSTKFLCNGSVLYCQLPSRRCVAYAFPQVIYELDEVTGQKRPSLQYQTWDGVKKQWVTARAYGGHLAENVTQATARDILADAMIRVEEAGFPVVLHVHDELLCEVSSGSPDDFQKLMCASEPWAKSLPVAAEAWSGTRYAKA